MPLAKMRMTFLFLLLLFSAYHQEIEAGKARFLKGLKKLTDKVHLTGDRGIFGKKNPTNTDNLSKPSSDTKLTQVAPTITAPSIPSGPSSYQPPIRNQQIPAAVSVAASTTSTQPAGYQPPIPSMPLSSSGPGFKGSSVPPLTATTKTSSDDDGRVIAHAVAFVTASQVAGYDPSGGIGMPFDITSVDIGGDGGGGGGDAGGGGDTNIVAGCLCAIGSCLLEMVKSCDPTQCCCCGP